jgi:hypothetical protein
MAAVVLTVRKTSDDPTSETASTWLLDGAGVAAIAAVHDFTDLNELLYPIHHILANLAVVVAIVAGWHAAANRTVLIRVLTCTGVLEGPL